MYFKTFFVWMSIKKPGVGVFSMLRWNHVNLTPWKSSYIFTPILFTKNSYDSNLCNISYHSFFVCESFVPRMIQCISLVEGSSKKAVSIKRYLMIWSSFLTSVCLNIFQKISHNLCWCHNDLTCFCVCSECLICSLFLGKYFIDISTLSQREKTEGTITQMLQLTREKEYAQSFVLLIIQRQFPIFMFSFLGSSSLPKEWGDTNKLKMFSFPISRDDSKQSSAESFWLIQKPIEFDWNGSIDSVVFDEKIDDR